MFSLPLSTPHRFKYLTYEEYVETDKKMHKFQAMGGYVNIT